MEKDGKLTRYREGSLLEIGSLSFPLMISLISGNVMLFFDRLILARYSPEAMSAVALAAVWCLLFQYTMLTLASHIKVLVGRHNGAGEKRRVGEPVWQMIWLAVGSLFLYLPLAKYGAFYFLPQGELWQMSSDYYRVLMPFGPIYPLQGALTAFCMGIGRVKVVTVVALLSNLINIALDFLLIFGVPGWIPELGCYGAALATGISQCTQVAILFAVFLLPKNRQIYGTGRYRFRWPVLKDALRLGLPTTLGHVIELAAWAFMSRLMVALSTQHMTMLAMGHSFYLLIGFFGDGLQQGVTVITSNYLGACRVDIVQKVLRSALRLLFLIALVLAVPFLLYPQGLISLFLGEGSASTTPEMVFFLRMNALWVWLYFVLDGTVWSFGGVLTAGGDTKFIMIANSLSAWLFAIVPTYFIMVQQGASPAFTWSTTALYGLLNSAAFWWRYRKGHWKQVGSSLYSEV